MADSTPETVLTNPDYKSAKSIYEFCAKDIQGNLISLEKYRGQVLIIVNVASQCGLTATNYDELVQMSEKYKDKGFKVLAFPCNQFNGQEPGSSEDIVCFALKKNAHFDFFEKINVNGNDAHPLWSFLKHKKGGTLGSFIKWNFTKFVINKEGIPVERAGPNTNPSSLTKLIESLF